MKKVFVTMFAVVTVATVSNAQEAKQEAPKKMETAPMQPQLSKEQKEAMKAKKEADLVEAFKTAGLTTEEQSKVRQVLDESNLKSREVKMDAKLTESEKETKKKEIYEARNAKIKDLLGDAKAKALKQAQKAQKEAATPVKE